MSPNKGLRAQPPNNASRLAAPAGADLKPLVVDQVTSGGPLSRWACRAAQPGLAGADRAPARAHSIGSTD